MGSIRSLRGRDESPRGALTPYERVAWVCLHLLVFVVPLATSNLTWLGYDAPWTFDQFDIAKVFAMRGLALVALAAWGVGIMVRGGRVRLHRIWVLILALLAWLVVTTATSIHWQTALTGKYRRYDGLLSFITYAAVLWVAIQLIDRASRVRSLSWTLVASGTLVACYGLLQVVGLDPITWGSLPFESNRAFSTYGNPDLLAGYLVFPFLVAVALALSERVPWRRGVAWGMVFLLAGAGLTAYVRGAWIGATVGLVIIVVAWWRGRSGGEAAAPKDPMIRVIDYTALALIGVLGVVVIVTSLGSHSPVTNVLERVASIFEFGEGSAKTRFQIWEAAVAAIKERPIFGWGLDTFRLLFPKFKPLEYTATAGYLSVADNVHNYPLQTMSAIGIPGFLMLYGVFGWALARSAKEAFAKRVNTQLLIYAGFWAAVVAYLVHLMFGISVTGSTVFLWLAVAVLLTPHATTKLVRPLDFGRLAGSVAAVGVSALLLWMNTVYIVADHDFMSARLGQAQDLIHSCENAIARNPLCDAYRTHLGNVYQTIVAGLLDDVQRQRQQGVDPSESLLTATEYFGYAEEATLSAIEFVPYEYHNYVFITNLYIRAAGVIDPAYFEDAVKWGLAGVEIEPYGPAIRVQLARAYWGTGEYEKALEQAELAASMDPAYMEPRLLAADLYMQLGRYETARDAYRSILDYNPNDATALSGVLAAEEALSAEDTGSAGEEQTTIVSDVETDGS